MKAERQSFDSSHHIYSGNEDGRWSLPLRWEPSLAVQTTLTSENLAGSFVCLKSPLHFLPIFTSDSSCANSF